MSPDGLTSCIQRYIGERKENLFKFLAFLQCMTTNFSHRRYDVSAVAEPILILWSFSFLRNPSINSGEGLTRKDDIFSVLSILFKFQQLIPRMWRDNRNYIFHLRIGVPGRNETEFFRYAEESSCSWTTSTSWLWHWNPERRWRDKQWYRGVSQRNASATWKAISILCKILSFVLGFNYIFYLQVSFGTVFWPSVPEYIDELIEALIEKKVPFVRLLSI